MAYKRLVPLSPPSEPMNSLLLSFLASKSHSLLWPILKKTHRGFWEVSLPKVTTVQTAVGLNVPHPHPRPTSPYVESLPPKVIVSGAPGRS